MVYQAKWARGGYPQAIVKDFRKRMQFIGATANEADFYARKALLFVHCQSNADTGVLTAIAQPPAGFSTWPPNSKRMADSSLSANSSTPRDANRW